MTSFFPDLNVWLALTVNQHSHREAAWRWHASFSASHRLLFCRYTQVGLLRLLTNRAVMGQQTCSLKEAWSLYDRWVDDPAVFFVPEPRSVDETFREVTKPLGALPASKSIGDCYLLAFAREADATLITFDRTLAALARKHRCPAAIPA